MVEGEPAPAFTLPDADSRPVSLRDFRGKHVVVYFYPRDDTPGCTKEACGFRDAWEDLQALGVVVLGISPDTPASHRRFAAKHDLPFPLLADPERTVLEAYGAYGEKTMYGRSTTGVIRSSVWIGPDGRVLRHWARVSNAARHPEQVLAAVAGRSGGGGHVTAPGSVRPLPGEYGEFYRGYVERVGEGGVLELLERQGVEMQATVGSLSEREGGRAYAPGKWTVKEVLGHLADAERVFACRALCFARGDRGPLPGFDQDAYVVAGRFTSRRMADLAREVRAVREATLALYRGFDPDVWDRRGVANEMEFSVRAVAYVIAGHESHHRAVLRDRYGIG